MYIKEQNGRVVFSLHLDQKAPSYAGAHVHNAEYEGEVVEAEIKRLKNFINDSSSQEIKESFDKKEKSWWKNIFS